MTTTFSRINQHSVKCILIFLLGLPAAVSVQLAMDKPGDASLAPLPSRPASLDELLSAPPKLNAWVDDHFGGRKAFIQLGTFVRFHLFREFPTIQMVAGQHGRYFLASHVTTGAPYQAITAVCGKGVDHAGSVAYLDKLFGAYHAAGLRPKLMVVPSAPVVHPDDVPPALVAECSSDSTALSGIVTAPQLAPVASSMLYPLQEMREIKNSATLFPATWFHWTGAGLDQVARLSMSRFWQGPPEPTAPLRTRSRVAPSDVSHLFVGVKLASEIVEPDLPASGIKACMGGDCFPEVAAPRILQDVSRFHNPAAPARRLLIISDSFGVKIAPWYARYYREVEHFATNHVAHVSPAQMEELKTFMYRDPERTDILILYHDGSVVYNVLHHGTERLLPAPLPKQG